MTSLVRADIDGVALEVIRHILAGMPLRQAIETCGIDVFRWGEMIRTDKAIALAYAHAQETRADLLVDEALQIADSDGDYAKIKTQVDVRKWIAERAGNKRWGNRVDLNVTQTIDIGQTLSEARGRMLPMRYQLENDNSQVIDVEAIKQDQLSDLKSLRERDNQLIEQGIQPDIFS